MDALTCVGSPWHMYCHPQVFVANPKKPSDISIILYKNRDKLIAYLNNFHLDREDAQFVDEKRLLIE
jgi:calcium binding protein 39